MYKTERGQAKRVLAVGVPPEESETPLSTILAPDGMLIVMEPDAARAAGIRARLTSDGFGNRATVIFGDPARMLYKLGGPFDVIFCSDAHLSLRPMLDKLLATDGVIITNGQQQR